MKIIKESKLNEKEEYVIDDVGIREGTLKEEEIEGIVYGHDEEDEYMDTIKFKVKKNPTEIEITYINEIFTEEEKEKIKEILKDNIETNFSEILEESKATQKKELKEDWQTKLGKEHDLLEKLIEAFGAEYILRFLAESLGTDLLGEHLAWICQHEDFGNEYIVGYEEDKEDFDFDKELEESAGHRVETGFIGVPDIEDAQSIVNQAIELFKRVPAGLYDDLDAAGFYVDANNKVHKKIEEDFGNEEIGEKERVEESKEEIKKWIDNFMSNADLSSHISYEGKKVYRTYGTRAYYYLMCDKLGLIPRKETAYYAEAENDDFELNYIEGDIDLIFKNDKYFKEEEKLQEDYETNIDWEGGVQEITKKDYYNFLDSVQPIYWDKMRNNRRPSTETKEYVSIFMDGEPFSYDEEKKKNLYAKFGMKDGKYYYLGLDTVERI